MISIIIQSLSLISYPRPIGLSFFFFSLSTFKDKGQMFKIFHSLTNFSFCFVFQMNFLSSLLSPNNSEWEFRENEYLNFEWNLYFKSEKMDVVFIRYYLVSEWELLGLSLLKKKTKGATAWGGVLITPGRVLALFSYPHIETYSAYFYPFSNLPYQSRLSPS